MECQNPRYLSKQDMVVPCGNCAFCGATKRSDWALRLHYESRKHLEKRFITLTYADAHLRWKNGMSQLDKRDVQLWLKRVRRTGAKVRYFAVGEYGAKTFRPHYHIILFGSVSDSVIRECWPLGLVHIGTVTQASIMYCLGYIINGKGWKMRTKRTAPFSLMSRKPGLGYSYLSKGMVEWHRSGRKNYAILDGEKRHLPRYYKQTLLPGSTPEKPVRLFSKIDLVRIAVRDQKAMFRKAVEWLRSPSIRRLKDPLAYRAEQRKRLAQTIRGKCKINLSI